MALHMQHTGSGESLTNEQYLEAVAYLHHRTQEWSAVANGPSWYCFDTAVLALCLVTLQESSKHVTAIVR